MGASGRELGSPQEESWGHADAAAELGGGGGRGEQERTVVLRCASGRGRGMRRKGRSEHLSAGSSLSQRTGRSRSQGDGPDQRRTGARRPWSRGCTLHALARAPFPRPGIAPLAAVASRAARASSRTASKQCGGTSLAACPRVVSYLLVCA